MVSAVKQGRRAGNAGLPQSPETQELLLENAIAILDGTQAPVRIRKPGKWGDEGSKSARKNSTNLIEQERFQDTRKEESDDEDDIPIIPDVDDLQEHVLTLHEVKAPTKMNWDEDIDFLAAKRSAVKQGRRAGNAGLPQSPETQEVLLENAIDILDGTQAPVRIRKTGKWADEGSKSARKNSTNLIEQERFQDTRKEESDDEDDIPIIPDIDDLQEDILTLHEVKAPTVSVNKATYKELDSELVSLQRGQKIANLGNINLSFLTSRLYPEKEVKEVDELWTMEELYENMTNMNK